MYVIKIWINNIFGQWTNKWTFPNRPHNYGWYLECHVEWQGVLPRNEEDDKRGRHQGESACYGHQLLNLTEKLRSVTKVRNVSYRGITLEQIGSVIIPASNKKRHSKWANTSVKIYKSTPNVYIYVYNTLTYKQAEIRCGVLRFFKTSAIWKTRLYETFFFSPWLCIFLYDSCQFLNQLCCRYFLLVHQIILLCNFPCMAY